MHVDALFFASYRDLVGTASLRLEIDEGTTVSGIVAALRDRGEPFDRLPRDPAVAVNREYAHGSTALAAGDEVAFIPPVAGG